MVFCRIPVSYTHLDVYKRQVDGNPITSNKFLSAKEVESDQLVKTFSPKDEAKNNISPITGVQQVSPPEEKKENLENNDPLILRSAKRNVNINACLLYTSRCV